MVSAPSLGELASLSGGTIYQGQDVTVEAIGLVAQELAPGALFAAVPGTRVHGATFAADTEAAAILTDEAGVEILQKAGDSPNPGSSACAFGVGESICPGVWGSVAAVDHDRYYGNLR